MSRFFSYDDPHIARIYDRSRSLMGVDVIAGLLHVHCRKPLKDIHLLDAGCGTGQPAKALLDHGLGKITLLDASREMLTVAKEKLSDAIEDKRIDAIVDTTLPNLPFADRTFDAVLFYQSLHHLDKFGDGRTYPVLEQALTGTHRVLKEDGVLLIMTDLSSTVRESLWFLQAHVGIREKIAQTYMPVQQYISLFQMHNFKCVSAVNLLTATGDNFLNDYFDPEGPLKDEWRRATSVFDIATDEEIKEMEGFLLDKKRKGTLEKFMIEHNHTQDRGYGTLFAYIAQSTK